MANSTFSSLKQRLLQLSGSNYNANDATRLELAGNCINQALGIIQGVIKGHPFTLDIGNSITATSTTPFGTVLPDTNIIEVLQVSQRVDPRKMVWIPYTLYRQYMADPTRLSGTPSWYWTATQEVNVTGTNVWSLYFIPTPSGSTTVYYDYEKNIQFSADGTTANAEFSPLPSTYDKWIIDEAKPIFYEIIMPMENATIMRAQGQALETRARCRDMIMAPADGYTQAQSPRERGPMVFKEVQSTTPS